MCCIQITITGSLISQFTRSKDWIFVWHVRWGCADSLKGRPEAPHSVALYHIEMLSFPCILEIFAPKVETQRSFISLIQGCFLLTGLITLVWFVTFFLRGAVRAVNYLDSPQIVRRVERLYKRGLQCSTTVSFVRLNPRGDDCWLIKIKMSESWVWVPCEGIYIWMKSHVFDSVFILSFICLGQSVELQFTCQSREERKKKSR